MEAKSITVFDLVSLADNKDIYIIHERDTETNLYEGRAEYLRCCKTGEPHELCGREVDWVEPHDYKLVIWV